MSISDYAELEILDHFFGKGVYTPPTIWVGVSTADPGDDAAALAEPSGGSYARVETEAADWNTAASGATTNANVIEFAEATGSWGTITYICLFDAETEGNLLWSGALGSGQAISNGNILRFAASSITATLG